MCLVPVREAGSSDHQPRRLPEPHRTNFFRKRADEQYKQILEQQAEAEPPPTIPPTGATARPLKRWPRSSGRMVSRWMIVLTNFGHLSGGKALSPLDAELQQYSAAPQGGGHSYTWKNLLPQP